MEKFLSFQLKVKYIVEDSSFVISLLDKTDIFHNNAVSVFKSILRCRNIKTIIPSTVFYETLFVLLKNGIEYNVAKQKLNNLMMIDQVINLPITETGILKLAKLTEILIKDKENKTKVRSNDLLIISIALNQENSCLVTNDIGFNDYKKLYEEIFFFSDDDDIKNFEKFINSN